MDCGTFRDNHAALIDEAACDADLIAMRRHVSECAACAAHDTAVRRALLLFRNMPTIAPSPDFSARLDARLEDVRAERRHARERRDAQRPAFGAHRGPGVAAFAGLAAAVILAGYLTLPAASRGAPIGPIALAPVVAIAPFNDPTAELASDSIGDPTMLGRESDADAIAALTGPALTSPAFMASVSAGSSVWPATVLAAHPPARLAAAQLKLTSLGR